MVQGKKLNHSIIFDTMPINFFLLNVLHYFVCFKHFYPLFYIFSIVSMHLIFVHVFHKIHFVFAFSYIKISIPINSIGVLQFNYLKQLEVIVKIMFNEKLTYGGLLQCILTDGYVFILQNQLISTLYKFVCTLRFINRENF